MTTGPVRHSWQKLSRSRIASKVNSQTDVETVKKPERSSLENAAIL